MNSGEKICNIKMVECLTFESFRSFSQFMVDTLLEKFSIYLKLSFLITKRVNRLYKFRLKGTNLHSLKHHSAIPKSPK